jgi:uncharacterized protein (TIGR03437 family)
MSFMDRANRVGRQSVKAIAFLLVVPLTLLAQNNPVVRFQTNLGNIDVELYPQTAPKTVANFMSYVNKGAYTNSIFHRSVETFIVQGGGFRLSAASVDRIPSDPAVQSEYSISNTRGTIAMALGAGNPNSGTNQWFFNLKDNAGTLDPQSFTVFGKVADDASLTVMDAIARVPRYDSPWSSMAGDGGGTPLQNYRPGQVVQPSNFIVIQSIRPLGRAISAGAFGAFAEAAPGSYIEIYGTGLGEATRDWADRDFRSGVAPTTLEDVSVTVGGQPAFISYVSPTQVNAQVPENVPLGASVPVIVSYQGQERAWGNITIKESAPGLLAPASFKIGDYQFVAAHHQDGSLVAIDAIPDVPAAPARAGEILTIYGLGFGAVESAPVAGRVATGTPRILKRVQMLFGDTEARVDYAGLVPGLVGLYQYGRASRLKIKWSWLKLGGRSVARR